MNHSNHSIWPQWLIQDFLKEFQCNDLNSAALPFHFSAYFKVPFISIFLVMLLFFSVSVLVI